MLCALITLNGMRSIFNCTISLLAVDRLCEHSILSHWIARSRIYCGDLFGHLARNMKWSFGAVCQQESSAVDLPRMCYTKWRRCSYYCRSTRQIWFTCSSMHFVCVSRVCFGLDSAHIQYILWLRLEFAICSGCVCAKPKCIMLNGRGQQ